MALNETREHAAGGRFYPLAMTTLIVLVVGLATAYAATSWIDTALREKAMDVPTSTHIKTVGAQPYTIPAALMPDIAQHTDGFADRIDMALALPLGPGGALSDVAMVIQPRGRARTSAVLLDTVYLHQFGAGQTQGVPGLVGKPLEGDAGVTGETVWYDPLSPRPFVAKCMTPVEPQATTGTCLRTLQLSDRNTAIISFDPAVLANWRQFDAIIEAWLNTLRK